MADTPFTGFQSKFKFNQKLNDCARFDKDHIGQRTEPASDRKGPHVGLIHQALNAFAQRHNPPILDVFLNELDDAVFDTNTGALVELFKTEKGILNFQGKVDRIVGKKTVIALDKELPPTPDNPPGGGGDTPVTTVKFRDALVVISAIGHRREIN